ncbi:hypothetical protein [Rhodopirellula bahusiensis]|uniref:Uncharacterized protein n=1 Tax=Rhodopirellula bahusiensis TaxID=2014065 RepID=A0A2G1W6H6_9BACT|nr:hypothetical protein [Rhodopirellula bahusiensis]PHQ34635.1 hypothetical protein CEE69_14610 [Rhodopirellula bahusiensis]
MLPNPYQQSSEIEAEEPRKVFFVHRFPVTILLASMTIYAMGMSVMWTIDPIIVFLMALGWGWVGWPVLSLLEKKLASLFRVLL